MCYPNENISTAQIFKSLGRDIALTCDRKKIRIQDFLEKTLVSGFDFCKLSELSNDLQGVALKICPKLLILYDELIRFGKPRMTGSGSAFFVYRPFLLKQNLVELSSFGIVKVLKSIEKHPFIVYK